jgi:hypothetical protein
MADYYTQFSLLVHLPARAFEFYQQVKDLRGKNLSDAELPEHLRGLLTADDLENWWFDCQVQDANSLWIYADKNGSVEGVAAFLQHLVRKFGLPPLGFTWASTCSKPRIDAFSGGACWITASHIEYLDTAAWLQRRRDDVEGA